MFKKKIERYLPKKLKALDTRFKLTSIFFFTAIATLAALVGYQLYYKDKIYPGIYIASSNVGGKTRNEARKFLSKSIQVPEVLSINAKEETFSLSLKEIDFGYDYSKTTERAYSLYRQDNFWQNTKKQFLAVYKKTNTPLEFSLNQKKLDEYIEVVSSQVSTEPIQPSVSLEKGSIKVDKGKAGESVNKEEFKRQLMTNLSFANFTPLTIPFEHIDPSLTDDEAKDFGERARKFINKSVTLNFDGETLIFDDETLLGFLDAKKSVNREKISESIKRQVSPKFNREPQNAVFKFENGRVQEFLPAKEGVVVDEQKLLNELIEKLATLENTEVTSADLSIPAQISKPTITTAEVNDLGIRELLGRGISTFRGSIPGRIFNIGHAASKFNGVLVPPGEILSFNNTVGEVSSLTGYKQAYIIKDGATVLGDGGGVCQVSTTLFRAALNAGLPIVERRAHSYRVSYYEQNAGPGLDATVYAPTTDLKFKNDTPGHILIQTAFKPEEATLIFEIYGTSDGRIATLSKPVILSSTPPPQDLYIDDPTLPTGQIKQIDFKAWGAKVIFDYKVVRNGQTLIDETFTSNYRPWQAKFLRGTGPVQ